MHKSCNFQNRIIKRPGVYYRLNMNYKLFNYIHFVFFTILVLFVLNSCGTMRNGYIWGEHVNYLPGWKKIGNAAYNAALAHETWIPLSGALIVHVADIDQNISGWASKKTPIFGSQESAARYSDYLSYFSRVVYWTSALFAPGGENFGEWTYSKIKGYSIGILAYHANKHSTDYIKIESHRLRPDRSNYRSFPSGHTSKSAVYYTLAIRNLESFPRLLNYKTEIHTGFTFLTAVTAWARIEAKRHYPTDVLFGAALGNFLGSFINDAFIGIEHSHDLDINLSNNKNSLMLNLTYKF